MFRPRFKVVGLFDESVFTADASETFRDVFKCAPALSKQMRFPRVEVQVTPSPDAAEKEGVSEDVSDAETNPVGAAEEESVPQAETVLVPSEELRVRFRASLLHRPMWDDSEGDAKANWFKVMVPELEDMLPHFARELQTLRSYVLGRDYLINELRIEKVEFAIDPYVFVFGLDDSGIIKGAPMEVFSAFRDYLNAGAFAGYQIREVEIPVASEPSQEGEDESSEISESVPDQAACLVCPWLITIANDSGEDSVVAFDWHAGVFV